MAEEDWEKTNPWILNKTFDLADKMLDSHESANVLISLLIVLSILPILGIGILLTRGAAPTPQVEIQNN